jgi:hypothetical protein
MLNDPCRGIAKYHDHIRLRIVYKSVPLLGRDCRVTSGLHDSLLTVNHHQSRTINNEIDFLLIVDMDWDTATRKYGYVSHDKMFWLCGCSRASKNAGVPSSWEMCSNNIS